MVSFHLYLKSLSVRHLPCNITILAYFQLHIRRSCPVRWGIVLFPVRWGIVLFPVRWGIVLSSLYRTCRFWSSEHSLKSGTAPVSLGSAGKEGERYRQYKQRVLIHGSSCVHAHTTHNTTLVYTQHIHYEYPPYPSYTPGTLLLLLLHTRVKCALYRNSTG